jgi:uncharacterized caspase-like protein
MKRILLFVFFLLPFLVFSQDIKKWFPKKAVENSGTKTALVIGNADYTDAQKLINPINDAKLIHKSLQKLEFDTIIYKEDLTYNEMASLFNGYYHLQSNYDLSVIYYAGHGVQDEKGNSFLIPVDFKTGNKLGEFAISVRKLLLMFSFNEENKNLFIFDACREAYNTGISKPDIKEPLNIKIGFSTSHGYVAYDHPNLNNSIYTSVLAKILKKTSLTIHEILSTTFNQVYIKTNKKQAPAHHFGYLLENDYLK